eukprot:865719-Lingulodinium_polyedra.AAC.1
MSWLTPRCLFHCHSSSFSRARARTTVWWGPKRPKPSSPPSRALGGQGAADARRAGEHVQVAADSRG